MTLATLFLPLAQPLDAVLFVLAGTSLVSLHIRADRLRKASAGLATALAAVLLAEYLFRIDVGVDGLLFAGQVGDLVPAFPGRPAPLSCAGFLLLGTAALLSSASRGTAYLAAGFGGLEIVFGAWIWRRHGG